MENCGLDVGGYVRCSFKKQHDGANTQKHRHEQIGLFDLARLNARKRNGRNSPANDNENRFRLADRIVSARTKTGQKTLSQKFSIRCVRSALKAAGVKREPKAGSTESIAARCIETVLSGKRKSLCRGRPVRSTQCVAGVRKRPNCDFGMYMPCTLRTRMFWFESVPSFSPLLLGRFSSAAARSALCVSSPKGTDPIGGFYSARAKSSSVFFRCA